MDKLRTKRIWKAEGLPTPEWLWIEREADLITAAERFGLPLIIKPSEEGSGVGVSKVKHPDQLHGAWQLAPGGEGPGGERVVMAERFIAGELGRASWRETEGQAGEITVVAVSVK